MTWNRRRLAAAWPSNTTRLGFKSFHTTHRTIVCYEILAMVRKRQVTAIPANDMPAQAA
ncbi:hypothetical protein ACCD06_23135 [Azospirillum sp. CT11-132]|uniref:hypothetical protein n=1 Tax=Azospirillum sp. CT11-132 TaxID=3396317 RepID=UPI0039A69F24